MGRLVEIAIGVMEEQDRLAGADKGAALSQTIAEGSSFSVDTSPSYDINDINDQSIPDPGTAPVSEPCRFFPLIEDLEQFAQSRRIVPVYLEAIGETILIVADNAPPTDGLFDRGYIVYTASEWKDLIGVTVKHFCFLHDIKKLFGVTFGQEPEE